jgi:hypothetical protein
VPLDDGARQGSDRWRELAGVQFCHWDRWLLRLAVDEPDGLRSIARTLQRRTSAPHAPDLEAEALLAQLADLETRLTSLGRTPATMLDDVERKSTWLHAKALRRVWHAASFSYTEAMRRTPRALLEQRARSGNWHVFSISPAAYLAELASAFGDYWHDLRMSQSAITLFELAAERLLGRANTDDERLAIRRAALAAVLNAIPRVDDSFGELGQQFRDHEHAYLELLRHRLDRPGLLRDLLELVVWEDYGLFHEVEPFLRALSEPDADRALRELTSIIAELRAAGLEPQLDKAQDLRRAVLAAAEAFAECKEAGG